MEPGEPGEMEMEEMETAAQALMYHVCIWRAPGGDSSEEGSCVPGSIFSHVQFCRQYMEPLACQRDSIHCGDDGEAAEEAEETSSFVVPKHYKNCGELAE